VDRSEVNTQATDGTASATRPFVFSSSARSSLVAYPGSGGDTGSKTQGLNIKATDLVTASAPVGVRLGSVVLPMTRNIPRTQLLDSAKRH